MKNPYRTKLEVHVGTDQQVVVHRANAPDLNGTVAKVDDDGCTIKHPRAVAALYVFVAYEDIRGIGQLDWDLE